MAVTAGSEKTDRLIFDDWTACYISYADVPCDSINQSANQ